MLSEEEASPWPLALGTLVLVGAATALLWRRFTTRAVHALGGSEGAAACHHQAEPLVPELELPDEVVLHILSFLVDNSSGRHLAAASAVCSRWHQVAKEPRLYTELLRRQLPDQAWTPASVLRWCDDNHFAGHVRPAVEAVERQAREHGTIDWRTLYAIERHASSASSSSSGGGAAAEPRRKAESQWRWATKILARVFCRRKRLVMLGNDNAGKTTLLYMILDDQVRVHPPTYHPNLEIVTLADEPFSLFDLSSWSYRRRSTMYNDYLPGASGIVFVVDAADSERFEEARVWLAEALAWLRENRPCMPLLVLGNKIDRPTAVSEHTLKAALNLRYCCTGKEAWELKPGVQPVEVFMCSIVRRVGFGAGLRWLTAYC